MTEPVIPRPTVHARPAEGEADELIGFQRVMFWLRLFDILVVVVQAPLYHLLHPAILGAAVVIEVTVLAVQDRLLAVGQPIGVLRRRSLALLACDLASVYLVATAFAADPTWAGFYLYPLMSLEATIIAGIWAGGLVTGLSLVVYMGQVVLHRQLGNAVEIRSVLAALTMVAMSGGFVALYAHLTRRSHRHLRVLLDLTSALALHESEADAMRNLDRRLHEATGGRVRTVVVMEPDGTCRVRGGHAGEERILDQETLSRAFGDVSAMSGRFRAGEAVTYPVDSWSLITASLGLPDWARSATFVPIFAEGAWVGIMPVLWSVPTIPDRDRLGLLYALADQLGLALARGELAAAREASTIDRLTGLLNRRAIVEAADAYVSRAERVDGHAAVLLIEVDGLSVLDGRRRGDVMLRTVAAAVHGSLRHGDVGGRYDADSLLVVAADADAASALALAARIRSAVAGALGNDRVALAIGTAVYPDDGLTAGDLLEEADRNLDALPVQEDAPAGTAHAYPGNELVTTMPRPAID